MIKRKSLHSVEKELENEIRLVCFRTPIGRILGHNCRRNRILKVTIDMLNLDRIVDLKIET